MTTQKNKLNTKQGITLFIAVSIASIVLVLVINILNIAIREIQISGFLRESQEAFYAADAGLECALYYDVFDASTTFPEPGDPPVSGNINCVGTNILYSSTDNGSVAVTSFALQFSDTDTNTGCAAVTVSKNSSTGKTTVESRGVNKNDADENDTVCNKAPGQTQRLERALRATYPY